MAKHRRAAKEKDWLTPLPRPPRQRKRRVFRGEDDMLQYERALFEEEVAKTTAHHLESGLSREELAALYARAEVQAHDIWLELEKSKAIFFNLLDGFTDTIELLEETGDPTTARKLLKERSTYFNFDRLIHLAASTANATAGRRAALARYAKPNPKAQAKAIVFECWQDWRSKPEQYRSGAAFARAMLDKFPDTLSSQPVIEGWLRAWRRQEP